MPDEVVSLDAATTAMIVNIADWSVRLAMLLAAGRRSSSDPAGVDVAAAITSTTRPAVCLVFDEADDRVAVGVYDSAGTVQGLGAWKLSELRAVTNERGPAH